MTYYDQLKNTLVEANPLARKDIGLTAIVSVICFAALFSFIDIYAPEPEVAPIKYLVAAFVLLLLIGAVFHVLGIQFVVPNDTSVLQKRFLRTGFVFTRCNLYLFLNFCVILIPAVLFGEPAVIAIVGQTGAVEGSLTEQFVWTLVSIPMFGILWMLWFLFPRWFFNSMPFVYDKRAYSNDIKCCLRKIALPTVLAFLAIDVSTTFFEFGVETLVEDTGVLHIVTANILYGISSIAFLFGCVAAMISAARVSAISNATGPMVDTPHITADNLEIAAASTSKISGWKLIPYTDGNFVYYPNTRWNKGYVLTRSQAVELLEGLEKKGVSFKWFVIIVGVASLVGAVFGGAAIGSEMIDSSSVFYLACLAVLVVSVAEIRVRQKKFRRNYPNAPVCKHPFPNQYFRLRVLSYPFYSLWVLWLFSIFMLLMTVFFVSMIFVEGLTAIGLGLVLPVAIVIVMTMGFYMWLLFWRLKFGRIHGRKPSTDDLRPIDPNTGKMSVNPFS